MTDREVMQMALEALEMTYSVATNQWQAITALRARLKQPEQKQHQPWCDSVTKLLMSNPPQIPPCNCKQELLPNEPPADGTKLYTTPPQRKPLTDEEIAAIVRVAAKGSAIKRDGSTSQRIARAIEAAHGIKETP